MAKKQINLHRKPISKKEIDLSTKNIKKRMETIEARNEEEREFTDDELREFPKNVRNIETKAQNYEVTKTLYKPLNHYENIYEISSHFGDYILDYGISLLENGYIIKAGKLLNDVCGAEDWDRMWPYALFHKARIAAILREDDYVIEFLRRSFRTAAFFNDPSGIEKRLKWMIAKSPEFRRYERNSQFKRVIFYNYNTKEEKDKFSDGTF